MDAKDNRVQRMQTISLSRSLSLSCCHIHTTHTHIVMSHVRAPAQIPQPLRKSLLPFVSCRCARALTGQNPRHAEAAEHAQHRARKTRRHPLHRALDVQKQLGSSYPLISSARYPLLRGVCLGRGVCVSRVRLLPRRVALKARASLRNSVCINRTDERVSAPRTAQHAHQSGNKRTPERTETVT